MLSFFLLSDFYFYVIKIIKLFNVELFREIGELVEKDIM